MIVNCLLCNSTVSFLKLVRVEHKENKTEHYICFECIRYTNEQVAHKYREQGWHVTRDALIVNTDYNKGEAA